MGAVMTGTGSAVFGLFDRKDRAEGTAEALSSHYKVTPTAKPGDGAFPELTCQIGDLTVTFGPDARGGFFLNAENNVLAALARTPPPAPNPRKR